jgi:hypothetical protein
MSNRDGGEARRKKRKSIALWSTFGVVALVVFLVLAHFAQGSPSASQSNPSPSSSTAPASVVKAVTSIPASVFDAVGVGSATNLPKAISAPALTQDGKPRIVYIGAEYCPFCATERWPMVIALSRFGTFSNLQASHSSTTDQYPNTQTFTFHSTNYTSHYLVFTPVETYSNMPQGNAYAPLDSPTSEEQNLINTYDAAPYVSAQSAGAIPFIYFGGQFLISGATYQPDVLQGQSLSDIAGALSNTGGPVSQGAIGSANVITAAICKLTNNQPANVCSDPMIQGLQSKLSGQ